jgi:hypothetical protein
MAREFSMQFAGTVLTENQQMIFKFTEKNKTENSDKPGKDYQLKIVVKSLEGAVIGQKALQVSDIFIQSSNNVFRLQAAH